MAHISGQHGTNYDQFSAGLVAKAVEAVVGKTPQAALNKGYGSAPGDPLAGLLAVYSRALAGDEVARASWAAIGSHDPGLARLVTKAAKVTKGRRKPKNKRRGRVGKGHGPLVDALTSGQTIDLEASTFAGRAVYKAVAPGPATLATAHVSREALRYYSACGNRQALALLMNGTS